MPAQNSYNYGNKSLLQWILIYLIIGGLIYAAIYFFFIAPKGTYDTGTYNTGTTSNTSPANTYTTTTPTSPTSTQTSSVTLTKTGFTPQVLTISVGTMVTWTNDTGKMANVSSAPHPTHTDYPPLNLGNFQDGESVSLVFNQAGTYKYHNHLNSSQYGTIIVQ